ncbi:GNAT family N-acetyltransferase [uncultured Roseobacter sp.]|uniref:GNAT family N-acetyltransferase n=1 Tax=uncultured Roseobacter sp. TaxID=114847 RepID=UPI002630A84E|nr:GNAT family N-acetyltransferase [uncultured Roseobacter sp.]
MIREARPEDAAALEAFLHPHSATSMFLRGNLAAHGVGNTDHANGTTFYVHTRDGDITGVLGRTNGGFLMCQAPGKGAAFWSDCAEVLGGQRIVGMTGAPDQIGALATALGLRDADFRLRHDEPLYELRLLDLSEMPSQNRCLRRAAAEDVSWLADWFDGYHRDTGKGTLDGVDGISAAKRFIDKPDGRIMEADGVPCAMSALNARTEDMVQIGGVYVPSCHRGRGHGARIVALHLAELRDEGITKAILFAASPVAAHAYESIGFRHIGHYGIALLETPMTAGETP